MGIQNRCQQSRCLVSHLSRFATSFTKGRPTDMFHQKRWKGENFLQGVKVQWLLNLGEFYEYMILRHHGKPWNWSKNFKESPFAESDVAWPHDHFLAADFIEEKHINIKPESNNPSVLSSEDHQTGIKHPVPCLFPYIIPPIELPKIINTPSKPEEM